MNFDDLIGKTYSEQELYELLLFELEENLEKHFSEHIHLYFDRIENQKICLKEVVHFKDREELYKTNRAIIEKREYFEITHIQNHIDLMLCRFDRTGYVSIVGKDFTHTQDWCRGWADEIPHKPMTPEEIRQAFRELAGFFEDQQELQKLRSKKAV